MKFPKAILLHAAKFLLHAVKFLLHDRQVFSPEGLEGRFKFFHCNFMQDVLEDFQRRFEAQIAGA